MIGRVRQVRIFALAVAIVIAGAAAAGATPLVQFLIDSFPVNLGRHVLIDVDVSKLTSESETPDAVSFLMPAHWRFDTAAVARECTAAQAAAVACPRSSMVGFGHVVAHIAGYLFPGGETDLVAYLTAFLGRPVQSGDPASLEVEVEYLAAGSLINTLNQFLTTKIKPRYSVTGRIIRLTSGRYGLEASFSSLPGGIQVPPSARALGVSAKITTFKLDVGAVRRVRHNFVRRIPVETASGPSVLTVHDHVLVPHHLFDRPAPCPANLLWPWQLVFGFPQGRQTINGTVRCGGQA
jgi:hypothetical protein